MELLISVENTDTCLSQIHSVVTKVNCVKIQFLFCIVGVHLFSEKACFGSNMLEKILLEFILLICQKFYLTVQVW